MHHFFWSCSNVQKILLWVKEICLTLDKTQVFHFDYKSVILNNVTNGDKIGNFVMLVAKQYLYSQRCLKKPISKQQFKDKIESYRRYELYYAIQQK